MAAMGWKRCGCCGKTFAWNANKFASKADAPPSCNMCTKRGGLCLHNLRDRVVSGQPLLFHSSRPHDTDEYADDPTRCPPCVEARENAEWGRRVMKLNPVGTWPVASRDSDVPEREV